MCSLDNDIADLFLFPQLFETQRLNSGSQTWEKVSLPSEPYHQVLNFIFRASENNILPIRENTVDLWLTYTTSSSISQW